MHLEVVRVVHLLDGGSQPDQTGAVENVIGHELVHLIEAGVQGAADYGAQSPLVQTLCGRVHRHQAAGMGKSIVSPNNLVFGRLEDQAAAIDADFAAEDYLAAASERLGQPRLVEPGGTDDASVVAKHGLGGSLPSQHGLVRLPHGEDGGLVVAGRQLGDLADVGVVAVARGVEMQQVADGGDTDLFEQRQQAAVHAPDAGYLV